jgi:hypothetical protein
MGYSSRYKQASESLHVPVKVNLIDCKQVGGGRGCYPSVEISTQNWAQNPKKKKKKEKTFEVPCLSLHLSYIGSMNFKSTIIVAYTYRQFEYSFIVID